MFTLRLCAWHVRFNGYPKLIGFSRWCGGLKTHGVCLSCKSRVMREWRDAVNPK